jgi:multimeric flavodoxin WrbA
MEANSMRIIGLNGSPRHSQSRTGQLIEQALVGAKESGADIEFLDITKFKISPCIACDKCHKLGNCIQKDDFEQLLEKIMSADGLLLGSPVYNYQVTAQLKTFFDRLGNVIHCQRFAGKYGAVVVTSGGDGLTQTADYLEFVLRRTGIQHTGRLAPAIEEDGLLNAESPLFNEARELGKSLVQTIVEKKTFPEQLAEMEGVKGFFCYAIGQRQDKWSWEYHYFKEKGWL